MFLNMGINGQGSAAANIGPAQTPAAAGTSPAGPTTIGQKAFGIVTGSEGGPATAGWALCAAGTLALAGLWYIWWSLPR